MTIHGNDISHYQGSVDFPAVRASGHEFTVLKATQGTEYVDPLFVANREGARGAGLLVGSYHFANATDPVAEAWHFCTTVGSLEPGEFVVLDWETNAADPVGWCVTFLERVHTVLGVMPLVYLNRSTLGAHDWSPVIALNAGLWLADPDGNDTAVPSGQWPVLAMKQYTDNGSTGGVAGPVDLDVFFGSIDQLRAYGAGAPTPPLPAPQPVPAPAPPPPPPPAPAPAQGDMVYGERSERVRHLQEDMTRCFPAYNRYTPTGFYGDLTKAGIAEFQFRVGIVGGDGANVGPKTRAALARFGITAPR